MMIKKQLIGPAVLVLALLLTAGFITANTPWKTDSSKADQPGIEQTASTGSCCPARLTQQTSAVGGAQTKQCAKIQAGCCPKADGCSICPKTDDNCPCPEADGDCPKDKCQEACPGEGGNFVCPKTAGLCPKEKSGCGAKIGG